MGYNIQMGLNCCRNTHILYLTNYYKPHTYGSWQKRMLANGGNKYGTQGKLGHKIGVNRI
tara:strand:- start:90 stop:269 length:180 start_codon:yes stop_codon:yes gene_type:complete